MTIFIFDNMTWLLPWTYVKLLFIPNNSWCVVGKFASFNMQPFYKWSEAWWKEVLNFIPFKVHSNKESTLFYRHSLYYRTSRTSLLPTESSAGSTYRRTPKLVRRPSTRPSTGLSRVQTGSKCFHTAVAQISNIFQHPINSVSYPHTPKESTTPVHNIKTC